MAALAEIEERLAGKAPLLEGNRFDDDPRGLAKQIGSTPALGAQLAFDHQAEFELIGDAEPAHRRRNDQAGKIFGFRLTIEDRHQRRGVDNHLGRPFSS